jgi:hypothetical protein
VLKRCICVWSCPQASYDPNAVGAVLVQFPYHVDSLLAMNELYRSMGEAQVRVHMCRSCAHVQGAVFTLQSGLQAHALP